MGLPKLKVSFDFDGVLSTAEGQVFAKKLIGQGIEVWITTQRRWFANVKERHPDLFNVAEDLGLLQNIQLTNYEDKYGFLRGFSLHIDDDIEQVDLINASPISCLALHYNKNTNLNQKRL